MSLLELEGLGDVEQAVGAQVLEGELGDDDVVAVGDGAAEVVAALSRPGSSVRRSSVMPWRPPEKQTLVLLLRPTCCLRRPAAVTSLKVEAAGAQAVVTISRGSTWGSMLEWPAMARTALSRTSRMTAAA
jgi:hypothetical protein